MSTFVTLLGYLAVAYIAYQIVDFIRLHVLRKSDLRKYGAKDGAYALVTGASDGIGKGFAEALARAGFNVILTARRKEVLEQVANDIAGRYKVKAVAIASDASKPDAVEKLTSEIHSYNIRVLVNNVGVNTEYPTKFEQCSIEDISRMLDVNINFTTKLTYAMIPKLSVARGRSLILMLSSYSGVTPVPMMAVYSSSKAYIDFFGRALATELAPSGIDVRSIVPHYVVSQMSRFRRATISVPDPLPFATSALKKIDHGFSIAPHWLHDIQTRITKWIPDSIAGPLGFKMMSRARTAIIAANERRKQKEAQMAKAQTS